MHDIVENGSKHVDTLLLEMVNEHLHLDNEPSDMD